MTGTPVVKKVPGSLAKFDQKKDGFVDLAKLSKTELLDLNHREEKLLSNRKFIDNLPDNGEKIKKFYERIQDELKKRNDHDKLCGLLASLNVNENKDKMEKLEWTGKYDRDGSIVELNDEEEVDPLKILATHSGTRVSRDIIQVKKENEVIPIGVPHFQENGEADFDSVENYAKELCHRFDSVNSKESRNKFYAHKSLNITSVKDFVKNNEPKIISSNSSDTAAGETKMLSLQESLVIQQQQMKHLKEVEMRHAMEKLMTKAKFGVGIPTANVSEYREQAVDSDDETSSIATNEDDDDKDTAVFYNLVD